MPYTVIIKSDSKNTCYIHNIKYVHYVNQIVNSYNSPTTDSNGRNLVVHREYGLAIEKKPETIFKVFYYESYELFEHRLNELHWRAEELKQHVLMDTYFSSKYGMDISVISYTNGGFKLLMQKLGINNKFV